MNTTQIGIRLSASGAAQVRGELDQASAGMERFGQAGAALERTLGTLRGTLAGVAGALGVREFIQAADGLAGVNARLKLATQTSAELAEAQRAVYQIAQANNVALEDAATLYARLADPVRRLGGTARETAAVTESVATALRIVGASTAESQSAILQFSQGLAAGALRGEEFNAVAEASPRIMQALADGLGKNRAELRAMAEAGQLTADVVGNALISQLGRLRAEAQGLPETVGGAFQRLRNEAVLFAGAMNDASGATGGLAQIIGGVAGIVGQFAQAAKSVATDSRTMATEVDFAAVAILGLGTVMETLIVLGSEVRFVFERIATQFAVVAKVRELVMSGRFDEGMTIWAQFKRDSELAREQLDRFTASVVGSTQRILAQRAALNAGRLSVSEYVAETAKLERQAGITNGGMRTLTAADPAANTAAEKAAAEAAKRAQAERALMAERSLKAIAAYERAEAQLDEQLRKSTQAELELAAARSLREQANVDAAEAAADRSLAGAQEMVRAIQDETAALTMSNTEREVAIALLQLERLGLEKGSAAYELYADKIRDAVVSREATRESIEQTRQIEAEWQRTSDQIGQALTDALMNGGKNAAEYLKGLFRSLVLRPAIEAVVRPFARQLAGAMNAFVGNTDGQGRPQPGGGFNLGRGFGDSVAFGANDLGEWLTRNTTGPLNQAGSWMMENANKLGSVANTLSNAAGYIQALQAADDGKWGQAIGTAVGQYFGGPMGAMLGNTIGAWLDKIFSGGAGTPHMGSAIRTLGDGTQVYMPGVVGFDRGTDQALRALGMAATGSVNALSGAFGGAADATSTIAFAADGNDASIGNLQLSMGGRTLADIGGTDWAKYASDPRAGFEAFGMDVVRATRSALDSLELPAWAREQLEAFDAELAKIGDGNLEAATDLLGGTVQAIAELQSGMVALQRYMEPLGGVFLRVSDLSGDAMKQLVDFAGGIEALGQQTQGFVQNYFSREEIAGLQSREIRDTLLGAGFTEGQLAGLDTRGEFRSLLESVDTSTEAGRRQLAALLGVSDTFAGLADYFGTDGGDLLSAAGQAPNTGALTPPGAAPGAQATESPAVVALGSIDRGIADAVAVLREVRDTLRTAPRVAITVPGGSEVQVAP